jgi:AraC-like DNA-binding protein
MVMSRPVPMKASYGSLHAILPLLEHLEGEGIALGAVLDRARIPRSALEEPRTRLPKGKFEALWQAAIEATGDPAIALRVSARVRPSTLGVIGYLASASDSPRNAFERIRGLTPLLWEDFACELECDDRVAFLRCLAGRSARASRFTTEYAIGLTVSLSRALGASRSDPLEARFSHAPPAYADDYERILGLPVRFDAGEDGVLFPRAMLETSNPSADAGLRQLLERYAADQMTRILAHAPLAERIRAHVRAALPSGDLTADAVATRLGMSSRTLRRRLDEEGTSYQALLDEVRAGLARRYLGEERRGVDEVAFLLGFSDPSAFTKAFRRWTGRTPAAFARAAPGGRRAARR